MRRVETVDTSFQRVHVWRSERQVEFRVAGAIHAWWHRERFLTGLAWDNLAAACLLRPGGAPRSVLMLGLAGGTTMRALRHLLPGCRLTAVEIDPQIISLARHWMELDALRIQIVRADAYLWLRRNRRRFDVVIDDVYLAGADDVYRPGDWGVEQFGLVRRAVAAGGLLAVNLVTGKGHRAVQSRMRQLFRDTFPAVRSVTTPESLNETLVGGAEVAGRRALAGWSGHFTHPADQRLWRRLKVVRL